MDVFIRHECAPSVLLSHANALSSIEKLTVRCSQLSQPRAYTFSRIPNRPSLNMMQEMSDLSEPYELRIDLTTIGQQMKSTTSAKNEQLITDGEREALNLIRHFLDLMPELKHFRWPTELPFPYSLLKAVPSTLQALSINITQPHTPVPAFTHDIPLNENVDSFHALNRFSSLRELEISGISHDQPIIWRLAWRNQNLKRLILRAAQKSVVTNKEWNVKKRVASNTIRTDGQRQATHVKIPPYCGQNGNGIIHRHYGYGEYLDVNTIRHARLAISRERLRSSASALASAPPDDLADLSIKELHLEGFFIDALPFLEFFSELRRLTFSGGCIDAGFALPDRLREQVDVLTVA